MNTILTTTLLCSLTIPVLITCMLVLWRHYRLPHYEGNGGWAFLTSIIGGEDDKWSFKRWVGPLTSTTAALSLLLGLIQTNTSITGLSLLCGAAIVLLPTAYNAACWQKTRMWVFLIFTTLTFCIVANELMTAALLADDEVIRQIPALYVHAFRSLMWIAMGIAGTYYWRSTSQVIKDHMSLTDETSKTGKPDDMPPAVQSQVAVAHAQAADTGTLDLWDVFVG